MKTTSEKSGAVETMGMENREVLSMQQDLNNVLTGGKVAPTFQGHYFNADDEKHGIANLIADILREREAEYIMGAENSEFRKVVLATSMFASEIIDEVKARFTAGTTRYNYNTVHVYLSVFMNVKNARKLASVPGLVQVKLDNKEDSDRPKNCFKPRRKYYLVKA